MKTISKKIMFSLLTLVIMIPICAVMSSAKAVTYESAFPDANFRQCILNLVGKPKASKEIDTKKLAKIKTLNVAYNAIESMEGIKYLTGLTSLKCSNNFITSLDVSSNTALTKLDCSNNRVKNILDKSHPTLTSLNVSGCTNLQELNCSKNGLTSLDLSTNKALKKLDCSSNCADFQEAFSFSSNPTLTSLNVSGCTNLQELNCSDNILTSLDISKNTALQKLNCNDNKLTSLDVSKNTALQELDCSRNILTSLDASKNPALIKLNCSRNGQSRWFISSKSSKISPLSSLNINGCTNLQELDCSYSNITSLDLSTNKALKSINTDSKTKLSGVSPKTAVYYYGSIFTDHAGVFIGVGALIIVSGVAALVVIRKKKKNSKDIEQ